MPLCDLLPPGLDPAPVSPDDLRDLARWLPELRVTSRLRPVRAPHELLGQGPGLHAITVATLEGEYAVLAGAAGAMWLGAVIGDDFVDLVVGRGGDALGRAVAAFVVAHPLGLGARRPRAYRHHVAGFAPDVRPGGITVWRRDDGARVTALPATVSRGAVPAGVAVATRRGLRGVAVAGARRHAVVLDDGARRYALTLDVPPGADAGSAARAFIDAVDGIEPLPSGAGCKLLPWGTTTRARSIAPL